MVAPRMGTALLIAGMALAPWIAEGQNASPRPLCIDLPGPMEIAIAPPPVQPQRPFAPLAPDRVCRTIVDPRCHVGSPAAPTHAPRNSSSKLLQPDPTGLAAIWRWTGDLDWPARGTGPDGFDSPPERPPR